MINPFDWTEYLHQIVHNHNVICWPPPSSEDSRKSLLQLAPNNAYETLFEFYKYTNGLNVRWLTIFPCTNVPPTPAVKLLDANDIYLTSYLGGSEELLEIFVVFADIGDEAVAVIDRRDGTIWYEEDGELVQTDLSLQSFISTCLMEMQ